MEAFKSIQDCVTACDYDDGGLCAGVTIKMSVRSADIGTTCMLIRGDASPGTMKRSVIRTDASLVGLPSSFLW